MATIRKHYGKWQVIIRKKGFPTVVKSFVEKRLASKYGKDVELKMEKQIFEDMSEAERTILKDILLKYRDEGIDQLKSKKSITYRVNKIRTSTRTIPNIIIKKLQKNLNPTANILCLQLT